MTPFQNPSPVVNDLLGTSETTDPVSQFTRKWAGQPLDESPQGTLQRIDLKRLKAGKSPLTASQTQRALQAASTRQPVTPVPEDKNPFAVWSNITSDITNLVKGIPQLPMAVVNEVRSIADLPTKLEEASAPGDFLQLPGIRLIPGTYTASAILPGGVPAGELATRPVSTALDVLPFVSELGAANAARALGAAAEAGGFEAARIGSLPAAEQARTALIQAAGAPGEPLNLSRLDQAGLQSAVALGEDRRFIPDLLFNKPNTYGEIVYRPGLERFRGTDVGNKLFMMSERTRRFQSGLRRSEAEMIVRDLGTDLPVMERALDWSRRLNEQFGPEADNIQIQIRNAIEDPALTGHLTPDEARTALPAEAQPFFDEYMNDLKPASETTKMVDYGVGRNPFIERYGNEVYTTKEAKMLRLADRRITQAYANLDRLNPERFLKSLAKKVEVDELTMANTVKSAYDMFPDPTERWTWLSDTFGAKKAKLIAEYGQLLDEQQLIRSASTPEEIMLITSPTRQRISAGLLNQKDFMSYAKPIEKLRAAAESRIKFGQRVLPSQFYATGKRLFWERARSLYDEAQKLDPSLRIEWNRIRSIEDGGIRRGEMAALRQQLDPETYRLLKYTRPDADALRTPTSDLAFRQQIRGFIDESELNRIDSEVRSNLNQLRENGYQPAYVPGVAFEKASRIDSTTIRPGYSSPDFAKSKTFESAPMHPDMGISVAYDVFQDWMARKAEPLMAQEITRLGGIRGDDLFYRLEAEGLEAIRKLDLNEANTDKFLNDYINVARQKGYVQYKPEEIFPTQKGLTNPTRDFREMIFLPREFEATIKRMASDEANYFQKIVDPISKTFRTSVLLFSPAWHFNNVLSGAMMSAFTNPEAFRYMRDEWIRRGGWQGALSREGAPEINLTEGQKLVGFEGVTGSLENQMISLAGERSNMENALARTRTASRIWNQIQESKIANGVVDRFNNMRDFSLGLNSFFDDMFRAANFDAYEASTFKQLVEDGVPESRAQLIAAERALEKTQTVFMDWTQMLPVERGILRSVFPFYAWSSHIMRLAFKLPFDHPFRVATINNFTRAELDDWQQGYPQIFRRLLGFADPFTAKRFKGLNVDAFNPFRDVGNLLTMAGMVSATNPIIQTVLRGVGVDPMGGGPEYAPNFIYDPNAPDASSLDTGNPIINLAGSIVPQARAIARFVGMDEQFRKLEETNPAAAQRMLLSGLRLPIIYRDVDVQEALALEEIKRFDAYRKAVGSAKQGDVGQLRRFDPALVDKLLASQQVQEQAVPSGNPLTSASRAFVARSRERQGVGPLLPPTQFVTV